MKPIVTTTAFLLFLGSLLVACDKSKDQNTEANSPQTNAYEKYADSVSSEVKTSTTTSSENKNNKSSQSYPATSGSKTNKKGEKMSAPDGSDKENHDGDMYTKNDTTRMPSGTTIK